MRSRSPDSTVSVIWFVGLIACGAKSSEQAGRLAAQPAALECASLKAKRLPGQPAALECASLRAEHQRATAEPTTEPSTESGEEYRPDPALKRAAAEGRERRLRAIAHYVRGTFNCLERSPSATLTQLLRHNLGNFAPQTDAVVLGQCEHEAWDNHDNPYSSQRPERVIDNALSSLELTKPTGAPGVLWVDLDEFGVGIVTKEGLRDAHLLQTVNDCQSTPSPAMTATRRFGGCVLSIPLESIQRHPKPIYCQCRTVPLTRFVELHLILPPAGNAPYMWKIATRGSEQAMREQGALCLLGAPLLGRVSLQDPHVQAAVYDFFRFAGSQFWTAYLQILSRDLPDGVCVLP